MPPDPWDDDMAFDERGDDCDGDLEDCEFDDDDSGYPFTPSNPFGERD